MWLVDDAWVPATSLVGREVALVDSYVNAEHISCCSFQVGFFIDVDGVPWSDGGTVDEPWMTMSWFYALLTLLGGDDHAGPTTGPWEESRLTWALTGDRLAMEDVHHSGRVSMRRVEVSFVDLARRICEGGRLLADITRAVRRELLSRRPRSDDGETQRRLDAIDVNLPQEGDDGLGMVDRAIDLLEARAV